MSNEIKEKEEYEKYARDHRKELDAQEVKLGDVVKVLVGQFAGETGIIVGISVCHNDYTDLYYEVDMNCEVPEKYKCRKTLITPNNVVGGVSAHEFKVLSPFNRQQKQRLIPKDYFNQILALQEKYVMLECECRRFTDWVINYARDTRAIAVESDNDSLNWAAREICLNLRPKTSEEKEAEKKALKDAVDRVFNNTIGR